MHNTSRPIQHRVDVLMGANGIMFVKVVVAVLSIELVSKHHLQISIVIPYSSGVLIPSGNTRHQ